MGSSAASDTSFIARLGLREGASPTANSPGWVRPTKVIVADLWPGRTAELARVAPDVTLIVAKDLEEALAEVHDADAVLGWLTPEILMNGDRLRWVQLPAAGVERYLAILEIANRDIVLTNAQRIFAAGAAEHVLGMVLVLSRRLHTALQQQRERRWDVTPLTGPNPYSGQGSELLELRGRTMLVVGLGGIGTEVARIAHGIGMRVVATRNSRREGPEFVDYVGLASELDSLVSEADVIVNSVPLPAATEWMFDAAFFSRVKSTAFFINIGRGPTTKLDDLADAIENGVISGAGLDVYETEPLRAGHKLWDLPNVILTPHVAAKEDAGGANLNERRSDLLFDNARRFAAGDELLNVVDKSLWF
ncbi:MAG: D-2-hydroxyacid dehydrogenase [Chloroflexi bacterium]|nr:D-2-hydroxyacid dehydrogenase [Chloroflexota bacterium]